LKSSRRTLLQWLAAGTALGAVGRAEASEWIIPANPGHVGVSNLSAFFPFIPQGGWGSYGQPRKVLEIFLRGGASSWGSLWYDATLGGASGTKDLDTGTMTVAHWNEITGTLTPPNLVNNWNGFTLGRAAGPLSRIVGGRKLLNKTRIIRVRHDLIPHELAIPYSATGFTVGRPNMCGLGAAIWRRHGAGPLRSLIFQAGSRDNDVLAARYLASTGAHGPDLAPPIIPIGSKDFLPALLRSGFTEQGDTLKTFLRDRYAERLSFQGAPVRAGAFSQYDAALNTLLNRNMDLYNLLSPYDATLFTYNPSIVNYHHENKPRRAINTAISLLRDNVDLKHIAVVDGGVEDNYDTHNEEIIGGVTRSASFLQNGNQWNVFDSLANRTNDILDNGITVLVHTDFGRIEKTAGNTGTEHHPEGFASLVISDLITQQGFAGTIDPAAPEKAMYLDASHWFSPTDVQAAVASIAGIAPWQSDMLDVDLSGYSELLGTNPSSALDVLGIA